MTEHNLELNEGERQLVLLALAELALSRPGFDETLRGIAGRVDNPGAPLYEGMKVANADRVRGDRSPLMPIDMRNDDEDLRRWIHGVNNGKPVQAGGFLQAFAAAICRADDVNYAILRPALVKLKEKFPKYRFEGEL